MPFEDDYPFASNLRRYFRSTAPFGGEPEDDTYDTTQIHQNLARIGITPFVKGNRVVDADDGNDYDVRSRMRELYSPESAASEAYMKHIGEMPVRNKPKLWQKIAAGFAAFGSRPDDTERVLYGGHRRRLEDWATKLTPLQNAANLERQQNINERSFANQVIGQEMSDRRLERMYARDADLREKERRQASDAQANIALRERQVKVQEAQLKINQELAKGGQFEVDDAGNPMIIRKDGSTLPVDAEYLTFEQKEELRAKSAERIARAREGAKRDRIVERTIEYPKGSGKTIRARVNLDTGDVEPLEIEGEPAGAPKSELEQSRDINNIAREFAAANRDLAKYVVFDSQGRFKEIKRPQLGGLLGPTPEQYRSIFRGIFGKEPEEVAAPVTPKPPARTGGPGTPKPPVKAPPGRVRVVGPNGEKGTVPVGSASQLPPGWRVEGR